MKRTMGIRIAINIVHITIGLYLLSLSNGLNLIPLLPDVPEEYKNNENHGYVLIGLGCLAFSQIYNVRINFKAKGGSLQGYINNVEYWDLIHIVHLIVSGPLLILLGLSKIGKFDYIDKKHLKIFHYILV